jgi:predicted CXXCH cytochrome family protein
MECSTCHDPHASQYAGLLTAGGNNDLCAECHGQVLVTYNDSDHSGQLCVKCHTPHGSAYRPLLVERNPELCLQCHDDSGYDEATEAVYRNNHPVRPNHYDVNQESPLTCTSSCHNPHGTDKTHMLRYFASPQDGACLICHSVTEGSRVGVEY